MSETHFILFSTNQTFSQINKKNEKIYIVLLHYHNNLVILLIVPSWQMIPNIELILVALIYGLIISCILLLVVFIILICLLLAIAIVLFSIVLIDSYDVVAFVSCYFEIWKVNIQLAFVLLLCTLIQIGLKYYTLASKPSMTSMLTKIKAQTQNMIHLN